MLWEGNPPPLGALHSVGSITVAADGAEMEIATSAPAEVIDLTALESVRVIVHGRQRFFREGLASLLSAESGVTIVASVGTADELERACAELEAEVVLVDLVGAR